MRIVSVDKYGLIIEYPSDVLEMTSPYRCLRCDKVHDVANVEVVGRYSDCTMWKCPNCGKTIDDRPIGWGGSAVKVRI